MSLHTWSNLEYAKKLVDSGIEGAQKGEQSFLHGEPLTPILGKSACQALKPAAFGAGLLLLACQNTRKKSASTVVSRAIIGGAIGFGIGLLWHNRRLARHVIVGIRQGVGKIRDEHWLEMHPIDYA
jgi:hypothetical protein